jgi:putative MATE family efflux protein
MIVKRSGTSMLEGPLLPNIILYTIPIILTSILQLLFNAADLIIVGRFCGSVSVAAVGATSSITNLMVNFFIGLSIGAGVTVAHGLGSQEDNVVHNTIHTALPTALVSGIILTLIGVSCAKTFLGWMGTPETVLPLSTIYMQIYFAGITFTMVYNFCAAILRAAGDTKSPLIYLSFSGVINVVLNIIFVTVFHLNVAGVALATTISQGISAALVVWALVKRRDVCHLDLRKMRIYKQQLSKMMRIGLPAGMQSSLFSISNVLIQSSINTFGNVFMSGSAASANIEGFVYASLNAFHQTAVNFIGQNAGAQQYKRVVKTLWICLICVAVVGLVLGSLAYCFGPVLLSLYITDSQEAIAYGMLRLSVICLTYCLCGTMDVSIGALRGLGESFIPMLISVLGVCGLRIGWIYTIFQIPRFHTPLCLFISYPISWTITFLCQMVAFFLVYRKHKQK